MQIYDFNQIKSAADCAEIARSLLGLTLSPEGRCAASWRGGTNPESVSINRNGWHDFAANESGSVIDLVARVRCGGSIAEAQQILGEYLHLPPKMRSFSGCVEPNEKFERLIAAGYREVKRYNYTDEAGNIINQVVRLEHPTLKKEFLQCTPRGWGLHDVTPPLYNLPQIIAADWVAVVEGEKDADSLIEKNIPATTVCGGAKKWRDEYTERFDEKDVVILPDNDEAGREHAELIAGKLLQRGKVKSVRIVPTSTAPKGDVSDYFAEGHSLEELLALIAAAKPLSTRTASTSASSRAYSAVSAVAVRIDCCRRGVASTVRRPAPKFTATQPNSSGRAARAVSAARSVSASGRLPSRMPCCARTVRTVNAVSASSAVKSIVQT